MSKYCTSCGAGLSPGARYCEECGTLQISAVPHSSPVREWPTKATSAHSRENWSRKKMATVAGVAASVLLASGIALYFVLRDPPLPTEDQLSKMVNADERLLQERLCSKNFDYGKSPVNIRENDNRTKALFDVLVSAGIYTPPEHVIENRGFLSEEILQFKHADSAKTFIRGNRLCFGSAVKVLSVSYEPVRQEGTTPTVRGNLAYDIESRPEWSRSEQARQIFPEQLGEPLRTEFVLHLVDGKWKEGALPANSNSGKQSKGQDITPTFGIFSNGIGSFLNLFKGAPEKSILGDWQLANRSGSGKVTFKPGRLVIDGEEHEVEYREEGGYIVVLAKPGNGVLLKLRAQSDNELQALDGTRRFTLTRLN